MFRHRVLGGRQDGPPPEIRPEGVEVVPGEAGDAPDLGALEPAVELPGVAAVVREIEGHGQAVARRSPDALDDPADPGLGDGVQAGVDGPLNDVGRLGLAVEDEDLGQLVDDEVIVAGVVGVGDDDVDVAVLVVVDGRAHVDVVARRDDGVAVVETGEQPVDLGDRLPHALRVDDRRALEAHVPHEPHPGLVAGVPAVGRDEDVGPAVVGEVDPQGADRSRAPGVGDGQLLAGEVAQAVVLVVDEVGDIVDRAADDVDVAVVVEVGGRDARPAAADGETRPPVVGELADLERGEVEVRRPRVADEVNAVLADGQEVDVAVLVDVRGAEVVGGPVDVDPGRLETAREIDVRRLVMSPELGCEARADIDVHRGQEVRVAELVGRVPHEEEIEQAVAVVVAGRDAGGTGVDVELVEDHGDVHEEGQSCSVRGILVADEEEPRPVGEGRELAADVEPDEVGVAVPVEVARRADVDPGAHGPRLGHGEVGPLAGQGDRPGRPLGDGRVGRVLVVRVVEVLTERPAGLGAGLASGLRPEPRQEDGRRGGAERDDDIKAPLARKAFVFHVTSPSGVPRTPLR